MGDPHNDELADETPEARFGAELRRLRLRANLSGRQLAKALHRAQSSIVEYELGRRLPSIDVVEQYEDYFELSRGTLGAQRDRARVQRLEDPRDATVDAHLGDLACPYKGMRAFEYEDAALFFGRESHIEPVLARLAEVRFVAVLGASGSGKSSFVRAGLLAQISATSVDGGSRPRVAVLTPSEHPLNELASAVSKATGDSARLSADDLRADPDRLRRAIGRSGGALVIVVDQFEELFTLCREEADRCCFVEALLGAWRHAASPVSVIVALRADFYGRVTSYSELTAAVLAHQALIGPMSPTDLRRAIELPAARTGLLLQPGLVDTILDDLGSEPGSLPLLSHALLETWKRRRRLMLTVSGYREAGGVRGAIAQTAELTLQSLPPADQAIARQVFLRLTDVGESSEPTRRRVDRAELVTQPQAAQPLDRVFGILANARLVTIDDRTIVVAHEALIRHWPRLRGWIDADRAGLLIHRRLTNAAHEWDTLKREPSALHSGTRLASAREWATEHDDDLSQLERDFLTASYRAEQRRTRRRRVLATGLPAMIIIVVALTIWAFDQRRAERQHRSDARRQAARATALELASAAGGPLLTRRPDVSLLLGLAAYRASPVSEAQSSVLAALTEARNTGVLAILHGHTDNVESLAFSSDGHILASAGKDNTIRLWNAHTHRPLGKPLIGHTSAVSSIAFSADGHTLASGGADNTIRLWDVRTQKPLGERPRDHSTFVSSVAFSQDGHTLASASSDTIRLWDTRTHEQLGKPLIGHTNHVSSVSLGADGRMLASASFDHTVRLWDVRTHKQLGKALRGHTDRVTSVAFTPDGRMLASAGADKTIRLWSTRTHKQIGSPLTGHTAPVTSVAFRPDGRTLASASYDHTVRLWDVRTHKQLGKALRGHSDDVLSVAFSPDRRTLASGSADATVRLWDVHGHTPLGTPLTSHTKPAHSVAFSPDGRTLTSAGDDMTIRLWDVQKRRQLSGPLTGHTRPIQSIGFSADGHTLASGADDQTIRLWDIHARRQLGNPLRGHAGPVEGVAFSADGHTLASANYNKTIRLWNVPTRQPLSPLLTGHSDVVRSVAFSPDGRMLASASDDHTIRLWDVRTHRRLGKPLRGPIGAVVTVAFSPDGRTLASSGDETNIRLWDVYTHKQLGAPLTGHEHTVRSVAFSPDGHTLASGSDDYTIRLWNVRTHQQLGIPLTGHSNRILSLAFSPHGRTLASASSDQTIRLWDKILWRTFAELQTQACNLVGSTGLSRSEWAQYAGGIPYRQTCR